MPIRRSQAALAVSALRWRCDPVALGASSTAELVAAEGVVGQARAVEALKFGLEIDAPGQNIYVRGVSGTGRLTLVRRLLAEVRPNLPEGPDLAYVRRFDQPDRPRLLRLPRGSGDKFRDRISELREYIAGDLASELDTEAIRSRRALLEAESNGAIEAVTDPLEAELAEVGLTLVFAPSPGGPRPMVLPRIEGRPASPEQIAAAQKAGAISDEELATREKSAEAMRPRIATALSDVARIKARSREGLRDLARDTVAAALSERAADIRSDYDGEDVAAFLDEVIHDVSHERLGDLGEDSDFTALYEVNLVACHSRDSAFPVIVENAPSISTLVGRIDTTTDPEGRRYADHMSVRAGSLVRADGGVLVLEARELLMQPGAWSALVRTLRTGRVDLVPSETPLPWVPSLKPDPIAVHLKVIIIGEPGMYYLLDEHDADFPNLFKVLADFDDTMPRDAAGVSMYGSVLARVVADEELRHFSAAGVAELVEHGARIAAERNRLTARFGRLADLAREAAYLAQREDLKLVGAEQVREAVRRTKRRAEGPARRFRERIAAGDVRIAVTGREVGQVNGLAVLSAGPLTYGVPTRITATVAPGAGGTINIERESQLSGAIHTKAFYILGGLLRRLLPVDFPLTFAGSIAFEQSYGGIDGDSASGAEICCLLSALTRFPIDQRLAMTGAIDQHGNILLIGAVNEKIEGFFDTCRARGPLDGHGVIIPASNVGDLMLRHDVVEACERGEFSVYGVDHIREAIGLLFEREAGTLRNDGYYPEGTVLATAVGRARTLYQQVRS